MNSYIVVTGASGWLGKTMVEALYNVFPYSECQQRLALFSSKRKDFVIHGRKNDIPVSALALQELPAFAEANPIHSFIHTAFLTKDRIGVYGLDRFTRENKEITDCVCKALSCAQNARVVGISSGAALASEQYSARVSQSEPEPYAILKYQEEERLRIQVEPLILRIFALSGRHMRDPIQFALGDFLLSAIRREQICIKAKMPVFRGYGYADDICMLAIRWLVSDKEAPSRPVDTVSHSLSLVELAELISRQYNLPNPLTCLDQSLAANSYTANSHAYVRLLQAMGLDPTPMLDQVVDTYFGLSHRNYPANDTAMGGLGGGV